MDQDYEIGSLETSLQMMCAVKVAHKVLLSSGIRAADWVREPKYNDSDWEDPDAEQVYRKLHLSQDERMALETNAMASIEKLNLPRDVEELVQNLIKPVKKSLDAWYNEVRWKGEPVLTPNGTVDVFKSVMPILKHVKITEVTKVLLHMFVTRACEMDNEDIFEDMFFTYGDGDCYEKAYELHWQAPTDFALMWFTAILDKLGELDNGLSMFQHAHDECFKAALTIQNDVAVKHFLPKASIEAVRAAVAVTGFKFYEFEDNNLSPALYCLLFAKLTPEEQRDKMSDFTFALLNSLLEWPYQRFFVDAATARTNNLQDQHYMMLLKTVAKKMVDPERAYNYGDIFIAFWNLGTIHRQSPHASDTKFAKRYVWVVHRVLTLRNAQLIKSVLEATSALEKETLLLDFHSNRIGIRLIYQKEYEPLKMFIRACGANNRELLREFRSRFLADAPRLIEGVWSREFNGAWRRDKWEAALRHFAKIVEEVIAEKRSLDAA